MATPVVAGAAALVRQYYMQGFYPSGQASPDAVFTPTGSLLKVRGEGGREGQAAREVVSERVGGGISRWVQRFNPLLPCCMRVPLLPPLKPLLSAPNLRPPALPFQATLLGGAAVMTGFEADTGLPIDPPPSFRQGYGRVWLGECAWVGRAGQQQQRLPAGVEPERQARASALATPLRLVRPNPPAVPPCHPPPPPVPGNSVYLAGNANSPQLQVLDAVPINQGEGGGVLNHK